MIRDLAVVTPDRTPGAKLASASTGGQRVLSNHVFLHAMSQHQDLAEFDIFYHQPSASAHQQAASATQHYSFFDDLTSLDENAGTFTEQKPATSSTTVPGPALNPAQSPIWTHQNSVGDQNDDDWGDFEDASTTAIESATIGATSQANEWSDTSPIHPPVPDQGSVGSAQRAPSADPFDNISSPVAVNASHHFPDVTDSKLVANNFAVSRDPNVLFDVEEELGKFDVGEEDDDFGDFEVGEATAHGTAQASDVLNSGHAPQSMGLDQHSSDLLGIEELGIVSTAKSPARKASKPATGLPTSVKPMQRPAQQNPAKIRPKPASQSNVSPVKPQSQKSSSKPERPNDLLALIKDDDAWDDFVESNAPAQYTDDAEPPESQNTFTLSQRPRGEPSPNELPPTNIPPPSILLSLFPPIFSSAQKQLFHPLSSQSHSLKNRILSDASTIEFLRGYLALATVLARIIAGRKLRWKRDTYLSQSMKISAASAGGRSGGMKLAGLDKAESAKEDREVADVVRAWKEQVGKLRSAVAAVKSADLGAVPEIQETVPVRTAKEMDGAVPSRKSCGLCGLKREERVVKGEGDVLDAFGEWWLERVSMHRTCWNFWTEHRGELRQR